MKHTYAHRKFAAAGLAVAVLLLGASSAAADPSGSKKSFTFPASCSNGGQASDLQVVVNNANGQGQGTGNNPKGQATFAPAHVTGSNLIFHPTKFNLTFTFAPGDGSGPYVDTLTASKPNGNTSTSCSIDFTTPPAPNGDTFSLKGTVLGFLS